MFFVVLLSFIGFLIANGAVVQIPFESPEEPVTIKLLREEKYELLNEFHTNRTKMLEMSFANFKGGSGIMYDYQDAIYVGKVWVGTPLQQFTVVLDTGSSTFWVPGPHCDTAGCKKKQKFKTSSSTWKDGPLFSIYYGTGSMKGILGRDNVALGDPKSQILVKDTTVGIATEMADFFEKQPFDGILGLAFPQLSAFNRETTFTDAYNQKLVDEKVFTIWMKRQSGSSNGKIGGLITYGGIDKTNCAEEVTYIYITQPKYWMFATTKIYVNDKSKSGSWKAITDSGTTAISVIPQIFDFIVDTLKAKRDSQQGLHYVGCNDKFSLGFEADGKQFTISHANAVIKLNRKCYLTVTRMTLVGASGDFPDIIFGMPMVRQYCQIHDMTKNRLGFAVANAANKIDLAFGVILSILLMMVKF